jgi:hypothetical protein
MGENWITIREWFHFADVALVVIVIAFVVYKILTKFKKSKV